MEYEYRLSTKDICEKMSDEEAGFALSADYIFAYCQANEIDPKSLSHDDTKAIIEYASNLQGNMPDTGALESAFRKLAAGDVAGAGNMYKKLLMQGARILVTEIERDNLKQKDEFRKGISNYGLTKANSSRNQKKEIKKNLIRSEEQRLINKGKKDHEIASLLFNIMKSNGKEISIQHINNLRREIASEK